VQTLTADLRERWNAFKKRVQATWFWRVFGICAMRKLWTKFLVAVAIAGFWLSALFGMDLLNPAPLLEQLNRTQGVLVHVYQPIRNAYGAKVRIRTETGEELTFRGDMFDDDKVRLLAAKEKRVTVWSMPFYEAWPPFYYERYCQIQEEERVLVGYERWRRGHLDMKPTAIKLLQISLTLVLLPVFIVILACRRGAPAE
jgi:hypothetical protein